MTSAPATRPSADEIGLEPAEFARLNGRLLGLAYRMLGSWADAEDVAAEAWLRWHTRRPEEVRDPLGWLTTVATRLSLDRWRVLSRRREEYVGPWLPEPVDPGLLPLESVEQHQTLRFGLLHLMDRLTPHERAVYVLRHAFAYTYPEIAEMLSRTPASCRQLGHRAQQRIGPVPEDADLDEHRSLLDRLAAAITAGRVAEAVALVSGDVVLLSDGGGRTRAALRPVHGADKVIRFLIGVATRSGWTSTEVVDLNGSPAYRVVADGVERVFGIEISGRAVSAVYVLGNPDKLARLRRIGTTGAPVHPLGITAPPPHRSARSPRP